MGKIIVKQAYRIRQQGTLQPTPDDTMAMASMAIWYICVEEECCYVLHCMAQFTHLVTTAEDSTPDTRRHNGNEELA